MGEAAGHQGTPESVLLAVIDALEGLRLDCRSLLLMFSHRVRRGRAQSTQGGNVTIDNHRASVVFQCNVGHEHRLCVDVGRGLPPELRCAPEDSQGYGPGNGGGCRIPPNLVDEVQRELRDNFQESKRRGYVLVIA